MHRALIHKKESFSDFVSTFVTSKLISTLLPESERVQFPIHPEFGLSAHIKIGNFENFQKRAETVRRVIWRNISACSDLVKQNHFQFANHFVTEINSNTTENDTSKITQSDWMKIGQTITLCSVTCLRYLMELPLVDPVEKANIKSQIFEEIREKFQLENDAADLIFAQTGRCDKDRVSQVKSMMSQTHAKLSRALEKSGLRPDHQSYVDLREKLSGFLDIVDNELLHGATKKMSNNLVELETQISNQGASFLKMLEEKYSWYPDIVSPISDVIIEFLFGLKILGGFSNRYF